LQFEENAVRLPGMTATDTPASKILPASTILLLRDGAPGLEVFMVKRHHQIDFASGALVFPGGKLAKGDLDPALRGLCDGAEGFAEPEMFAAAACGVREAFEESGILLARAQGSADLIGRDQALALEPWRARLDKGEIGLADFLREHRLRLALDRLHLFARWVTPKMMPKRFDTFFFLAAAPPDQIGLHDGRETVDSLWTTPAGAMAETDRWKIIFPTRMNLVKLARSGSVATALDAARADTIVTVEPWVEPREGGAVLKIQADAGYGDVEEPLSAVS